MFICLLGPVASDPPIGGVFKNPQRQLITIYLYLSDKDGNNSRIVTELSVSHSPEGAIVTSPSIYLVAVHRRCNNYVRVVIVTINNYATVTCN